MLEEEIIYDKNITDEELIKDIDNSPLKSTLSEYLKSIKNYPLLSAEEESELLRKYHLENDLSAKEKLVNSNLRFVIYKAKKYIKKINYFEFIDLIQEGNVGLIEAIDKYNIDYGSRLLTLADFYIEKHIKEFINHQDKTIDIKRWGRDLLLKYDNYIIEYQNKHGVFPQDDTIINDLNINEKQLNLIKNIKNNLMSISSLDKTISNDEDNYTLANIIPDYDNGYDRFLDSIEERSILYKLKNNLSNFEYYLIYHNLLADESVSTVSLSKKLGCSQPSISRKLTSCKEKIKDENILEKEVNISIKKLCELDLKPIDYPKKVILMYLKDKIDEDVLIYAYYSWYLNLPTDKLEYQLSRFGIDNYEYYSIYDYKLNKLLNNNYSDILKIVNKDYGIYEIFDYSFSFENNKLADINELLKNNSLDEVVCELGYYYDSLPKNVKRALFDYYDDEFKDLSNKIIDFLDSKINVHLLNYKGERELPLKKLYNTYLKNKDEFEEEHQEYLEGTLFSKFTKKRVNFDKKFNDRLPATIIRLEALYYNLTYLSKYTLTNDIIKETIEKYSYLFDEIEIKSLYMHYAIGYHKKYTENEIMNELNITKKEVRTYINYGYRKIIDLYLGIFNCYVLDDEEIYIKYINNPNFPLKDRNRKILKLRYIDHLDYKEIQKIMGFDVPQKVSNMIKKATYLIDCHEYNINGENVYEDDKIINILNNSDNIYKDEEKEVIKLHFINSKEFEEIAKELNMNINKIKRLCSDFCGYYIRYYAKKDLTKEEIEREVTCHSTDSIINEKQKFVLSKLYGIKCDKNIDGELLSRKELCDYLNINATDLATIINNAKTRIGARINGIIMPGLGRLSKEEIIDALKDKNIPLTDEEKDLLRKIKGINTETKTLEELADTYGINKSSVKRRLTLAYLSILKYQKNNKGFYDYEKDIVPILKYFPLYDRNVLIDLYKNKFTAHDIEKKYNISLNSSRNLIYRIDKKCRYILKYPNARVFDFEYAREVIDKDDLPFYGKKETVSKIYTRYYGDDGLAPDSREKIVDELNIHEDAKINYAIKRLMIACLMYKEGYRKLNTVTDEEIKNTYEKHKNEYNKFERGIFESYFSIDYERNLITGRIINDFIIYEVLKDKNEQIRHIKDLSQSEIYNILKNNPYNITKTQLEWIRNYKKIPKRNLMSGKRKIKLFKGLERGLNH